VSTPRLRHRRPSALLAVAALAAAAMIGFAAPASAHDQLVSSDPAAGASVTALPAQITLTFSAELLGDGSGGNEVVVTDAAGTALNDGPVQVDGTNLVQPLTGSADGAVSVQWRAVSSDGHPIAGDFAFTVAGAPAPVESTAPAETPEPTMTTLVQPAPSPTETAPSTQEAASPLPWILGAVILLAVIAVVIVLLVRPKGRRGPGTGSGTGADR
jgi:copper resistance protein C